MDAAATVADVATSIGKEGVVRLGDAPARGERRPEDKDNREGREVRREREGEPSGPVRGDEGTFKVDDVNEVVEDNKLVDMEGAEGGDGVFEEEEEEEEERDEDEGEGEGTEVEGAEDVEDDADGDVEGEGVVADKDAIREPISGFDSEAI